MKIKKNKANRREGENLEFFSEKKFFSKTRSIIINTWRTWFR